MRRIARALLLLSCAAALPATVAARIERTDPSAALALGNRRFAAGDLDGALAAYASGLAPGRPDRLLAYNLGSTAHHLGRLPEAVLWYRRAAAGDSRMESDRWLAENLASARGELQQAGVPPPDTDSPWIAARGLARPLVWTGVAVSWAALPLFLLLPSPWRRRLVATAAVLAVAAFAVGAALPYAAPRAAVLLAPCGDALPAGSEVLVRAVRGGRFQVVDGPVCPARAVGLIEP